MLVITPIFCALNPLNQSDLALVKCKWVIFMSLLFCSWNLIFFQVGHLMVSIDFHLLCQSYLRNKKHGKMNHNRIRNQTPYTRQCYKITNWLTNFFVICVIKDVCGASILKFVLFCTLSSNYQLVSDSVFNQLSPPWLSFMYAVFYEVLYIALLETQ